MNDKDLAAKAQRGLLKNIRKFAGVGDRGGGGGADRSHLALGDAARDRSDWPEAARHYRDALAEQPALRHIWIQLGHAEKESGDLDAAEAAYHQADALGSGDGEPALHLGHVAKLRGDLAGAKRHYLRAIDENPDNADAERELTSFANAVGIGRHGLRQALAMRAAPDKGAAAGEALASIASLITSHAGDIGEDALDTLKVAQAVLKDLEGAATRSLPTSSLLVFDASDLLQYFRHNRLPTGIQRVQIEVISNALSSRGNASVCCFSDSADSWIDIPAPLFEQLASLALSSGDRAAAEWRSALEEVDAVLLFGKPVAFQKGACLVNLGTSWWLQNYFLAVREAKRKHGIRYVPFVHDLIPIVVPEHCVPRLIQDFIDWAIGVFQHADFYLVNSQATLTDLQKVAALLGHTVDDGQIAVIPLDADFASRCMEEDLSEAGLARWRLEKGGFALMVSTIEPRKNHILVFDAWLDLAARIGADAMPKLVCVGNSGWLNETIHAKLQNPLLRPHVVMLSNLSDRQLAMLYESCRFTVYPSVYEGWGLPITESLCHGKVPIVSDSSSLPEAGGPFAVYFSSGSRRELVARLEELIRDDGELTERERQIREHFRPRTWVDVARQIESALTNFAAMPGDGVAIGAWPAQLGKYHPLERNRELTLWPGYVSAEIFRAGCGWWGPDDWGCWTKPGEAILRMRVPEGCGAMRLFLLLKGPPEHDCPFDIAIAGQAACRSDVLRGSELRWIVLDIPEPVGGLVEIAVQGAARVTLAPYTDNGDTRIVSLGVAGFFICETDDVLTRLSIAEAIAVRDEKSMAFNRPPSPAEMLNRSRRSMPATAAADR